VSSAEERRNKGRKTVARMIYSTRKKTAMHVKLSIYIQLIISSAENVIEIYLRAKLLGNAFGTHLQNRVLKC
jgi:hypothetical protein